MGTITRSIANNIVTGGKLDGTDGLNGTIPASNIADASLTNITSLSPSLGSAITSVSVDPPAPAEGQMWYNSSSGTLKGYAAINAWSAGGTMGTARYGVGGAGTQTAGLTFAGGATYTSLSTATESYNGTSWTTVNTMGTARYRTVSTGIGTQTAALAFGGNTQVAPSFIVTAVTESWNGTSWSPVASMNTTRTSAGGAGTQTAALAFSGRISGPSFTGATESWNGTSWTTLPATNPVVKGNVGSFGTQTAAISVGGSPPTVATTNSWNGTSWTTTTSYPTASYALMGFGTQTSAIVAGGDTPTATLTTIWDGTTWTATSSLPTGRDAGSSVGTQTSGLIAGGRAPGTTGTSVEWTGVGIQTITV